LLWRYSSSLRAPAAVGSTSLGCVDPTSSTSAYAIPANPTAHIHCTLPDRTEIEIETYPPAGMAAILNRKLQEAICRLAPSFGAKPPFYYVYGRDFSAYVPYNSAHGGQVRPNPKYHAQSEALATALGMKLSTLPCS
jgi:hypothetical protein